MDGEEIKTTNDEEPSSYQNQQVGQWRNNVVKSVEYIKMGIVRPSMLVCCIVSNVCPMIKLIIFTRGNPDTHPILVIQTYDNP